MDSGQANLKNLLHVAFLTMPSAAAESAVCLLNPVNHAWTAESALYLTVSCWACVIRRQSDLAFVSHGIY